MREGGERSQQGTAREFYSRVHAAMFEHNWIVRSALVVGAAFFIILTGYALATAPTAMDVLEAENRNAEFTSSQKEYSIGYSSDRGFVFTARSNRSANENEVVASDTDAHTLTLGQRDLLAQERMSHWTKYLGIFTGAGVVLLLFTLHETNETARYARDMLNEQRRSDELTLRAYLTFEVKRTAENSRIILVIKNVGDTPALNVAVGKRLYSGEKIKTGQHRPPPIQWGLSETSGLAIAPSASIHFPLKLSDRDEKSILEKAELCILYASVAYHDEWTYRCDDEDEYRATRQYFTAEKEEYENGGMLTPVPEYSGIT